MYNFKEVIFDKLKLNVNNFRSKLTCQIDLLFLNKYKNKYN